MAWGLKEHAPPDVQRTMLALAIASIVVHGYLGVTEGDTMLLAIGAILLVGVILFLSPAFEPVLYLVGAIGLSVLIGVWAFEGMPHDTLGLVDKLIQGVLAVALIVLFVESQQPR